MPDLLGILETSLYVEEFERACAFYEQVLGLNSIYRDPRLCAYDVGGRSVLLLFLRGRSLETVQLPGGTIPPHDGHGPVHIAFSIAADALAAWEARLAEEEHRHRGPHQMAARRREHLFPRPRRAFARAGDAGIVAGVLVFAPLPLAGRGWGWGSGREVKSRPTAPAARPHPYPSPWHSTSLHSSLASTFVTGLPKAASIVPATPFAPGVWHRHCEER